MGSGGFPIDLLLFGMIAAFLVLRLRGILGRKTGFERHRPTMYVDRGSAMPSMDGDRIAAIARAIQLKRPEVEFRQEVLPGQTHDLYQTYEQLVEIYTKGADFLLSHLGAK